jgi:lipoprotein-anchoring transpeptidase ErfK/SrfK
MKRQGLGLTLLCACVVAGVFAAFALADDPPPGTTTSTATTTTTTTPAPQTLPEGVAIGGVEVGGLPPAAAVSAIRDSFSEPLEVEYGGFVFDADPTVLAAPNVSRAIERARAAQPYTNVKLVVVVRPVRVRTYIATIAKRVDRDAVDAKLSLRNLKPFLSKEQAGHVLLRADAVRAITRQLVANTRDTVQLKAKTVPAKITRKSWGPVIVIHRGANRLYLYEGARLRRVFGVATGQTTYPTPLGRFQVIVKWKNPWWYPPAAPWAVGEKPTPPGPGNPLGTRWMGISAPGVGIHGTNNESSIGYSVSHGCIRMHVRDAEWLFENVDIGTTVYIVGA